MVVEEAAVSTYIPESEAIVELYEVSPPFAYAVITRDRRTGRMLYRVLEPILTTQEMKALAEVKRLLLESQRPALDEIRRKGVEEVLRERVRDVVRKFKLPVGEDAFDKLFYYVRRDMLGYGPIDVLIRDPRIEDISCDGVGVPIYVWHSRYESLPTNIVFSSPEELESIIVR
ncbi:MAG: protein kinase, partial [Thermofilaceae archaeon]